MMRRKPFCFLQIKCHLFLVALPNLFAITHGSFVGPRFLLAGTRRANARISNQAAFAKLPVDGGDNEGWNGKSSLNVDLNEFFKTPVPTGIKERVAIRNNAADSAIDNDVLGMITAPPGDPGAPRPLWLVILASVPTGLIWYGYYKFCVEEELLQMEIDAGKTPRGFGGYGTLGPFTYGLLLGPIAQLLNLPGGSSWTALAIVFIYYTQFLLYDRVNELYREEGLYEPPLQIWWCLPVFFPFNLIVGLRQVHFLSQYYYRKNGVDAAPLDPVAQFFPFIMADNYTWQEFLTKPSLWCSLLRNKEDIATSSLPEPLKALMENNDERIK